MDQDALTKSFLTPITSEQHMHDWVHSYLGLDLPMNTVDPESNASPIKWLFSAYDLIRTGKTKEVPGLVVYAPREGYKTLTTSILEVLVAVHFMMPVAHMAAIEKQSQKSVYYVNNFCKKLKPFLEAHGININSSNKRSVGFEDSKNNSSYINIIICTMQGANSEHTTLFVVDEVDVVRFPNAYEESKLIPGMMNGIMPLTILTSTRKFAFGLMQKEIANAPSSGNKVLHWNVIDVTEKCQPERHRPDLPKEERMINPRLPLRNLSVKEWNDIPETDKEKRDYQKIEAYAGCASCALLPVCKTRLATRSEADIGGLFKPIEFTMRQFSQISPEMGEAQLMCWKPSTTGLIYGRFDESQNILSLEDAWRAFVGSEAHKGITIRDLVLALLERGIRMYCSIDWGHAHAFAITVSCKMPNGEWWLLDTYAQSGLEFEDMVKMGRQWAT